MLKCVSILAYRGYCKGFLMGMMEMVRIAQMEIVRIAKKGNSSTISLTVELFPFFAIRTISHF